MNRSILLSAVAAIAIAAPAAAGPNSGNDPQGAKGETNSQQAIDCGDGNQITFSGDDVLWPPNHKQVTQTITADQSDDAGPTTLYTMSRHNEMVDGEEMNGTGNTQNDADDATGSADAQVEDEGDVSTTVKTRAERSGRGDGRTYTIEAFATFDGSEECSGSFTVEVPHDMRGTKGAENGKNGGSGDEG